MVAEPQRMRFTWSIETGRYRSPAGLVRDASVRSGLDSVIEAQATTMRQLTQDLVDGRIALSAWQIQMMQNLKAAHLVGLAAANGGWNNLNQSDFGWVGQRIRTQYRFLQRFAEQLASGQQSLGPQTVARAALYAAAARATHREAQRRQARARGMTEERNQLGMADHCRGCLDATAAGWVPIGTLVPVGGRDCLANCRCTLLYRFSAPSLTGTRAGSPREPATGASHSDPVAGQPASATTSLNPPAQPRGSSVPTAETVMAVSNKPWGQFDQTDYSPAQWFAATLIHLDGAAADGPKSASKLPVREPGGALNANGVHAAAAVLAGSRGGVTAPATEKRKAARALVRLYDQLDEDPPDSLKKLARSS